MTGNRSLTHIYVIESQYKKKTLHTEAWWASLVGNTLCTLLHVDAGEVTPHETPQRENSGSVRYFLRSSLCACSHGWLYSVSFPCCKSSASITAFTEFCGPSKVNYQSWGWLGELPEVSVGVRSEGGHVDGSSSPLSSYYLNFTHARAPSSSIPSSLKVP